MQYLVKFKKNYTKVQTLINSGIEINIITIADTTVLGLYVCFINIRAQKIDISTLLNHSIVLANFQLEVKKEKTSFF